MTMMSVAVTSLIVNIHLYTVNKQLEVLQRILYANMQTLDEINSYPSVWVNRTVVVKGKLWGPLVFAGVGIPPPWNYKLFRPNATQTSEEVFIGVLWNSRDEYAFEKTIVIGVVREGHWSSMWGGHPVGYYIEAQEIIRL